MHATRRVFWAGLLLLAALPGLARAQGAPADYQLLDPLRSGQLLRQGDSGPRVGALQRALTAAGTPVSDTGIFGQQTDRAVRSFQGRTGCQVDGVVGRETMRALDRALGIVAAPPSPPGATPALPPGYRLRRLTNAEVTPAIGAEARRILTAHYGQPYGTEVPFLADGRLYVGRLEQHYRPPGSAARPWGWHKGVSVFEVIAPAAPPAAPPAPPAGPALTGLPPRPADALTGSQFLAATAGLSRAAREQAIERELARGNVPSFLRRFVEVTVTAPGMTGALGGGHTVVVRVLPDYLAIGSDDDFVRIPMAAPTAQRVADLWGCSLPTRRLVDVIWREAAVRLRPLPMAPTARMMSNAYYGEHQRRIEAQLAGRPRGALVAGHKKDLVITNRLRARPDRVAIYGWHQPDGRPIQPLSTVHEASYADYSHGVRLVDRTVLVDGQPLAIEDVLGDPNLAGLLSDEGVIASPRIP